MNDFIYVPVEIVSKEKMPSNGEDFVVLFDNGQIRRHYEEDGWPFAIATHWLKKVPVSEYLKSISPIQEEWKEAVINEAEERFPTNSIHNDYELKMPAKIHRRLCRERFIQGAEWAKQYIEENIINKTT